MLNTGVSDPLGSRSSGEIHVEFIACLFAMSLHRTSLLREVRASGWHTSPGSLPVFPWSAV